MVPPPRFAALLACVTVASVLSGATKVDLTRMTPVAADQPIPVQDFFRHPLWREPKLNPSGTFVAGLVLDENDNYRLLTYDLNSHKARGVAGAGDEDIVHFVWLGDDRVAFFVSTEKLYGLGLYGIDVHDTERPYPILQYEGARLVGVPHDDPLHPVVWLSHDGVGIEARDGGVAVVDSDNRGGPFANPSSLLISPNDVALFRDSNDRHIHERTPGPAQGMTMEYIPDRDGHLAFAVTVENGHRKLYRLSPDRQWVPSPIDPEHVHIVAPGDRPNELIALVHRDAGKPRVLRYIDGASGEVSDVILGDKEYDFTGELYRDPATRQVVGVTYNRDGPRTLWFQENFRSVQDLLDAQFKGQVVRVLGMSEKGGMYVIATYSDRQPVAYQWVDLQKHAAGLIANTRPWIDPARMQRMQIMKFKTRDGHLLDAYVTLPKGTSKTHPAPLVVLPHGGPWVRDTWGFDSEAQFLASRGYAVIQPNYRGSPGYDWMFPATDQWEFRKMNDDVTDATKALLDSGVIDRNRVAIMGSSFGGYLALSGVANEPSLYRCAVTIAGVFDWATVLQQRKRMEFDNPAYALTLAHLGDPAKEAEKYAAISPLRHLENVHVPIFVAHGRDDPVASVKESQQLITELEKHNVPHEAMFVSGEGHGMHHVDNQVDLYTRIEAFLAKNLATTNQ